MTDFSFITSDHERNMVESAFNAITIAEKWEFLKTFEPDEGEGFMFTKNEEANKLMNYIDTVYKEGHSGGSMAWTMRIMQIIAREGVVGLSAKWKA